MIHTHQTAPTQFVQANSIRFAYRRFGKTGGVPLVLSQHYIGTMDYWDPTVTDLLARDWEVILFNNAGVSSSSGEVPTTFKQMGADAIAFIEALGLKQVDLFGFSIGGMVVQEITLQAPDLIRKLIQQVAGWERITDAVHQKRGYMFSQFWHTGRAGHVDSTKGATPVSSSVNPEYWQDPTILESTPHGCVRLRLTARSTSQKFRALSKIIAKRPSTPKPLDSMALSFTLVTATCLINFCKMASTGELIYMAARSKIAPASSFK